MEVFLPTEGNMPDKLYIFTFLATSRYGIACMHARKAGHTCSSRLWHRLFLPPHQLLSKLSVHIKAHVTGVAGSDINQVGRGLVFN